MAIYESMSGTPAGCQPFASTAKRVAGSYLADVNWKISQVFIGNFHYMAEGVGNGCNEDCRLLEDVAITHSTKGILDIVGSMH